MEASSSQGDENQKVRGRISKLVQFKFMPEYFNELCLVHNLVHLFNPLTGWKRLPDMTYGREWTMCGLVTNKAGGKKIVVAGGLT